MTNEEKLVDALTHVEDIVKLMEDNEWKVYLYRHLSTIKYELERQLSNERSKR